MKMFRAVPKVNFDEQTIHTVQSSRRTPGNVPFLVDNLWEWLRPEAAPNRRHSVYASPSAESALNSASSSKNNPDEYTVCEVLISGPVRIAQLIVQDAKFHRDASILVRLVASHLAMIGFSDLSVKEKLAYAPLFLPTISKEELSDFFENMPQLNSLIKDIQIKSTFWSTWELKATGGHGELFFELLEHSSFQLKPI